MNQESLNLTIDTYVEITLRQLSPIETELTLFHDEFLAPADRDSHNQIWNGVLSQLGVYLGRVKSG